VISFVFRAVNGLGFESTANDGRTGWVGGGGRKEVEKRFPDSGHFPAIGASRLFPLRHVRLVRYDSKKKKPTFSNAFLTSALSWTRSIAATECSPFSTNFNWKSSWSFFTIRQLYTGNSLITKTILDAVNEIRIRTAFFGRCFNPHDTCLNTPPQYGLSFIFSPVVFYDGSVG